MSLHYLVKACAAFEKTAAFSIDLEEAKAKANSLIPDMSEDEAFGILNVDPMVTTDLLELALKAKLIELREQKGFGASKLLSNKQHAIFKAYCVLEGLAANNSGSGYEFEGTEDFEDEKETFMDLGKMASVFERLAQQKAKEKPVILDPKKKNIAFYTNLLEHAIISITTLIPSLATAKQMFDKIVTYKLEGLAYGPLKELQEVEACLQALIEAESKLQQAGTNPMAALKQRMPNTNLEALNVLKTNLRILSEAKDFSGYKEFAHLIPDEIMPQEEIEFPDTSGPGY